MYAMQYVVTFPAQYDMQTIRDRVATTGHFMDGFTGLEFKAYLMQEETQGARRNAYAPFYVWRDVDGMRSFCWGEPGYSAIVRDFGRQPIQDWTVAGLTPGPADYKDARSLSMRSVPLPHTTAPSQCLQPTIQPFLSESTETTVARLAAVDVASWTVILVELSTQIADQRSPEADEYEVLHVSASAAVEEPSGLIPAR